MKLTDTLKNISLILACLFLFRTTAFAYTPSEDYYFTYLTTADGMAQNMVNHIFKDSHGFMWIATWNGLNRYDGYEFIRYGKYTDHNSLNSLFIREVIEDDFRRLWVATEEGVNVVDLDSGNIMEIPLHCVSNPVFKAPANTFLKDETGNLWIGFDGGLALVTFYPEGRIKRIEMIHEEEEADVLSLSLDKNGMVWVGYRQQGIRTIRRISDSAFEMAAAPGTLGHLYTGMVFALYPDGDRMWIGSDIGLFRYDFLSKQHRHYMNDPADTRSLVQDFVKDITADHEGNIIVATYKGLAVYNETEDHFLQISSSPFNSRGLNNNFCSSLFVDEYGTIWVGTEKGGINRMVWKGDMFKIFRHNSQDPFSISPNPVNAVFEDSRRNIWVGTVEGGLNKYQEQTGQFIHYRRDHRNPVSLSHNTVCYITEGGGYLWIATWGGGINRMKLSQEGVFEQDLSFVKQGEFGSRFISGLLYDEVLNGLWVTSNAGLEFFDSENNSVLPVLHTAIPDKRITSASHLYLDHKRRLWVGTEKALHCVNLKISDVRNGKFISQRYKISSNGKAEAENDKVNCIYEDKLGVIWIGTYGNALYRMDEDEEGEFIYTNYGTDAGLADNVVFAIEEDHRGNLWLSSNNGLSCFDPVTGYATTFSQEDGLPDNQFYWTSSYKRRNGDIYFGSVNGMVVFDPSRIKADSSVLEVAIVGGWLYNDRQNPIELTGGWQLHERDKSFSLSFSSLYYPAPEKVRYAYMLDGFDRDWTEVDASRRFATYTNLSAGKYVFKVKCTNPDGAWSDHITELNIRIIPPFYKERWFVALVAVFVLVLIWSFYEWRMRTLRSQKAQLEKMVEERTEKVESQKDTLAKQAKDLEETLQELMINQKEISKQNKKLIEKNNKISLQKQQLEELSEQLQQATQDKINFFTNITHEFKTPLTLVLGPIEQALKLSINPKVIEQLQLVQKNSKYLLSLINQLMDFRKAETQTMKINKTPGNFYDFLHSIIQPFNSLAQPRNVRIQEYIRFRNPYFRFDHDLMQKVVVNLLSNAVKFTPDGGQIRVSATLLSGPDNKVKHLYISVNDSGTGVPEEKRAQIFEPFFQLENKSIYPVYGQSGTGIGLYLCRQIVELLGGKILVKNGTGGGATFRILLPLEVMDLEVDPLQEYYDSPEVYDRSEPEEDLEQDPEDRDKPLVLIVEDNTDMRAFIRSILKERFSVVEASNGESGLAKTIRYMPDFIITDIMMPVMDGLEFCRKVKNNFVTSHIPVLLLTAKSSTDVRIEGYNVGADGYISKPFNADLLMARINNMIEARNRIHRVFEKSMDVKTLNMQEDSQDRIFLDKLMEIIQENYQDATFDVGDLMHKMHISKSFLHKKLSSLVGQTAVKVIRAYRLSRAKELIDSHTGPDMLNVSELAYEVGFNDPKYFTRCFTKQFGVNPSTLAEKQFLEKKE